MNNHGIVNANLRKGQRTALVASIVTLLLAGVKTLVGYGFDSPLLVADGFHTLSDFTVIFASWFGLFLAAREKTDRFPYGLYKAETLVSFVIGLFITWAGIEVFLEGVKKFGPPAPAGGFPLLPIIVSLVSVIIAFFLARREGSVGKAINSQSLKAIAQDSSLNIAVSFAVLAGIVAAYVSVPYVEGVLLVIISLLIAKLGLETIWLSLLILLDANLDRPLQSEIAREINNIQGVTGIRDVKIRQPGLQARGVQHRKRPSCASLPGPRCGRQGGRLHQKDLPVHRVRIRHIEPRKSETPLAVIPVKDINVLTQRSMAISAGRLFHRRQARRGHRGDRRFLLQRTPGQQR